MIFSLAYFLCLLLLVTGENDEGIGNDPNGINKIFHYLEEHPEMSINLIIKEDQLITIKNGTCLQYDYIYIKWIDHSFPSPFPDMTDGNEFCTVVDCDDVFGPAESVDCSEHF